MALTGSWEPEAEAWTGNLKPGAEAWTRSTDWKYTKLWSQTSKKLFHYGFFDASQHLFSTASLSVYEHGKKSLLGPYLVRVFRNTREKGPKCGH